MSKALSHGSLFAGIGGIDLGFERAGVKTVWQVEIEDCPQNVLAKRFPQAERFGDVRECGAHNLRPVDIISGGFPCQPFSLPGKGRGASDNRYLWPEMFRIVGEIGPRWVVAENVRGLLSVKHERIHDKVCADLEAEGYEVGTFVLPAVAFGLQHKRERVFVVAHANRIRREQGQACTNLFGEAPPLYEGDEAWGMLRDYDGRSGRVWQAPELVFEPVAHGLSEELVRLEACGNAVVPGVAEFIARKIVQFDQQRFQSADGRKANG